MSSLPNGKPFNDNFPEYYATKIKILYLIAFILAFIFYILPISLVVLLFTFNLIKGLL